MRSALLLFAAFACMALFVVTPLNLRTQVALAGAILMAALAIGRMRGRTVTLLLVLLSTATTGRYLWWRLSTTLSADWSFDAVLSGVLLGAELYACAMLLLAYAQSVAGLRRRPLPMPSDPASWPSVDVYVPTYNEPLEVVRATVLAAAAMDWPADRLRVFLLDDGRRADFRAFAAEAGVGYITRDRQRARQGGQPQPRPRAHAAASSWPSSTATTFPTRSFLQIDHGLAPARSAARAGADAAPLLFARPVRAVTSHSGPRCPTRASCSTA